MGSGLGVDSLIVTKAVGSQGRVVGIDLSTECVQHANKRSKERGFDDILTFVQSLLLKVLDTKLTIKKPTSMLSYPMELFV